MRISDWSSDVCSSDLSGAVVAGDFSRGDLEDFIRVVFRYNVMGQPNERIALGGEKVLAVLNKMTWLDGSYEIKQGETKLGVNVNTILTLFGTLKLMTHPLMNGNRSEKSRVGKECVRKGR